MEYITSIRFSRLGGGPPPIGGSSPIGAPSYSFSFLGFLKSFSVISQSIVIIPINNMAKAGFLEFRITPRIILAT
ncbi:MAG: hypothetical protein DRJ66_04600 [Thermoprotei archaeon]|nr:MAG: hypothetical protein DRJ66_04600 [Thermoprotei archaeon]RLF20203.1 MAG: hypothetical protein DRZ82_03140 [Thermoprotei archaeon]